MFQSYFKIDFHHTIPNTRLTIYTFLVSRVYTYDIKFIILTVYLGSYLKMFGVFKGVLDVGVFGED